MQISTMRACASAGCRARLLVRMKNPLPAGVDLRAEVSTGGDQVVRTGMAWQVWVPVGSSSRIMRRGVVDEEEVI